MSRKKAFDCIKVKDDSQARLAESWAGLSDEQARARMLDDLATSDDVVARWWRAVEQAGRKTHSDTTTPTGR